MSIHTEVGRQLAGQGESLVIGSGVKRSISEKELTGAKESSCSSVILLRQPYIT